MGKGRLDAVSDGVIAIIIMVLELKVLHGATCNDPCSNIGVTPFWIALRMR